MAGTLKHAKTSGKAAPTDTTKVGGPDWDADHNFAGGALGSLLYRDTGATDGANWLADVAAGSFLRSGGVGAAPVWSTTSWPNSATTGDLLYASGANAYANLAGVATGSVLVSGGVGTAPAWSATPSLTTLTTSGNIFAGGTVTIGSNVILVGETGHVTAQRNGTNPQTFRIYNTFTDSSNYERAEIGFSTAAGANIFGLMAKSAGTGTARSMVVGTVGTGNFDIWTNNTARWEVTSSGHILTFVDNTYDIGASGANRPRNLFLGGTLTLSGGTLLATSAALTNGAAAATGTLTNAPTAGNPTKWIPINDNGTVRYIPAW